MADTVKGARAELAALLESGGEALTVGGDHPFLLEGDSVWWVRSGKVDVFNVAMQDGAASGGRSHMFRVGPGGLLFGTQPRGSGGRTSLLAVGTPGTELFVAPRTRIWELARMPVYAPEVGALLDEWVDVLCGSMAGTDPPDELRDLQPDEEVRVERRAHVRSGPRVAWVRHEGGTSLLLGRNGLQIAGDGVLPLSRRLWMETQEGTLRTLSTQSVIGGDGGEAGLERLHALVHAYTAQMVELQEELEQQQIRRRAAVSRSTYASAWSSLASSLASRNAPRVRMRRRDEGGTESADLLFAACRLVAQAAHIELKRPPGNSGAAQTTDPLAPIARASRIRTRRVMLGERWWTEDGGPFVGWTAEDRRPVALLPGPRGGYVLCDAENRVEQPVTAAVAATLHPEAYTFYRTFGDGALGIAEILRFGVKGCGRDFFMVVAMGIVGGVLGLIPPIATGIVFNNIIPGAERGQLFQVTVILVAIALCSALIRVASGISFLRIETRMGASILAGVWDRLLELPVPFFRSYAAGNLATRAMSVEVIRQTLSGATISALMSGLFSLIQFAFLFYISVSLAAWSALLIVVAVAISVGCSYAQLKQQRQIAGLQAKILGTVLQFLSSIAKLRVAGAEAHAFAQWARSFSEQRDLQFRARTVGNLLTVFNTVFPVICSLVIFAMAAPMLLETQTMRTGDFLAFLAAFNTALAGTLAATGALIGVLNVVPYYEQARPILQATPEVDNSKTDPGVFRGRIELQRIVFRYAPDSPPVLRDVSLHIEPGEFVAFVGPSGSGKSTIMRLLLGFDQPESGAIYFDGHDLAGLDIRAVRSQIGVVLQNGQLMPGDIFTNIVGSAPATMEDAWAAARMSGFDGDIERMPMGMHTVIGEGGSTLSGGQRQRLIIARALVRRPRILLFDEATSALDNRTQAVVSESLARLKVTRVAIAHRLSTIVHADRIYVIAGGCVTQSGTYQELLEQEGLFADLARRQMV